MSFSSGVYSLPGPALNTGDTVSSTENNTFRNDVATAFNLTWLRNGTAAATADIPMGGFSLTGTAAVGSAGSLLLKTNGGTTAVTLDAAQNMGLGVTPSAWSGSYKALDITSGASFFGYPTNYAGVATNAVNNSGWKYRNTAAAVLYQQEINSHVWYTAPSGTAGNAISFTQAMTLDASGNLAIGSTTVYQGISGTETTVSLKGSSSTYAASFTVTNNAATATGYFSSANNGNIYAGAKSNTNFCFVTNDTERARIDSSGNLLVGTTSTVNAAKSVISFSSSNNGLYLIDSTGVSGAQFMRFDSTSSTCGSITRVLATSAVAYNTSSDYRLKENIAPMTGALDTVAQLKPCTYTWKESGVASDGFIAHELAEVCPQAVTGSKDAVDADGNPIYQGIDTSFLVATLTASIQEQQTIIQTLTERITALEGAK